MIPHDDERPDKWDSRTDPGATPNEPALRSFPSLSVRPAEESIPPFSLISDGDSSWQRRYQIIREISSGGMGTVYLARDNVLQRTVALKFIRNVRRDVLARFFQEAQAVAQLAHPNIVTLFGIHPGDDAADAPF